MVAPTTKALQPWQVITGGVCGLVLTIGLARFAYTPLLPSLQSQTGLTDAGAGALAAVNYAGYMSGALAAAWIDDVRWRHRLYSMGLWMALLTTAAMALSTWMPAWALWRYIGGLCGATGMLLGSGLVLGWLMRHGRRPELGLHFIGIGLGIVVSALGAWGCRKSGRCGPRNGWRLRSWAWCFLCRLGPGVLPCRLPWPRRMRRKPTARCRGDGCSPWWAATLRRAGAL